MSIFSARRSHTDDIAEIEDMRSRVPIPGFLERQDGGLPKASSLPAALNEAQHHVDGLRATLDKYAPPAEYDEPPRTDLEQIALWVERLTYTDMKAFASEVLGDAKPASAGELADLFEGWAIRKLGPKPEAAP